MARAAVLVFAGATAVAVALTWPLATALGSQVPSDVGDPLLNVWILWWNAHTVPLSAAWWAAPAFFPSETTLAFSEHLLGLTPISSPIIWLTGNPLLAYNVVFLLTWPLSTVTMYLLGRELTGRHDAGLVAGLIFGFAPYRIDHLAHLQILACWWMPLALLGLHRYRRTGGRRWLALFGGAWLLTALSNGYFLAFFSVLVGLWMLWFARELGWRRLMAIAGALALPALALIPMLLGYRQNHAYYGFTRRFEEIQALGADLTSLLDASPLINLWSTLAVYHHPEARLFPGATVIGLLVVGLGAAVWSRRAAMPGLPAPTPRSSSRSTFAFYAFAAVAMFALALGPTPAYRGEAVLTTGPYAWLLPLPGFDFLRVPARFAVPMMLCLAAAAAFAVTHLSSGRRAWRSVVVAGLLSAGVLADTWMTRMPLWDPPAAWRIAPDEIGQAMLVLPPLSEFTDVERMYRAMTHGRPLVNGYSGNEPSWYRPLHQALNQLDPAALDVLRRAGVTEVLVELRHDRQRVWRNFVETRARLVRVDEQTGLALYALTPLADPPPSFLRAARAVPVTQVDVSVNPADAPLLADGDIATRWNSGSQQGNEEIRIDLGLVTNVTALELSLGAWAFDYPRDLIVDLSDDGVEWRMVWSGRGDTAAVAAGLRAPAVMPWTIDLGHHLTRYMRLRQVDQDPTYYWSIAELRVLAAR